MSLVTSPNHNWCFSQCFFKKGTPTYTLEAVCLDYFFATQDRLTFYYDVKCLASWPLFSDVLAWLYFNQWILKTVLLHMHLRFHCKKEEVNQITCLRAWNLREIRGMLGNKRKDEIQEAMLAFQTHHKVGNKTNSFYYYREREFVIHHWAVSSMQDRDRGARTIWEARKFSTSSKYFWGNWKEHLQENSESEIKESIQTCSKNQQMSKEKPRQRFQDRMACLMMEFWTDVQEEIVTKKSHDFE